MTLVQPTRSISRPARPSARSPALDPRDRARPGGSRVFSYPTSAQARVWSTEDMVAFWQSLFFIALAEMGDKSQLVALAFATRFSPRLVLTGIFVATLLVHLMSVAIGEALGFMLPT